MQKLFPKAKVSIIIYYDQYQALKITTNRENIFPKEFF